MVEHARDSISELREKSKSVRQYTNRLAGDGLCSIKPTQGGCLMKNAVRWLRISYWWGIIADVVVAFLMLFPELFRAFNNIDRDLSADFGYGLRYGASLMIGWTVLLFWADRKPMERKDILPITLVVVAGLVIFGVYSISAGYTTLGATIPTLALQITMSGMFVFSYLNAKRAEASQQPYPPHE
jgi:hypothetical protein